MGREVTDCAKGGLWRAGLDGDTLMWGERQADRQMDRLEGRTERRKVRVNKDRRITAKEVCEKQKNYPPRQLLP